MSTHVPVQVKLSSLFSQPERVQTAKAWLSPLGKRMPTGHVTDTLLRYKRADDFSVAGELTSNELHS